MAQDLKTKTNAELIKLISDAAAELEWRRKANQATASIQSDSNDEDELGSIPDSPPPPPPPRP